MRTRMVHGSIADAMTLVRRAGRAISDVVYPKRCASCGERGAWVCAECLEQLPLFDGTRCDGCGVPHSLSRCSCDHMVAGLTAIRSVGPFDGWLRHAVINFKYHDEWARAEHLGGVLAAIVAEMRDVDALVPVPLHRSRLRERGYNQSALLATVTGEQLGLPVVEGIVRLRPTAQQVRLSGADRMANVEGAFGLTNGFDPTGRRLLLIDDVITTGATIYACTRTLIDHGTADVRAATLARQL